MRLEKFDAHTVQNEQAKITLPSAGEQCRRPVVDGREYFYAIEFVSGAVVMEPINSYGIKD